MRKKPIVLPLFLALLLSFSCLSGCERKESKDGLTVVCTVFPLYDWVRQLTTATDTQVILLSDNGADLHSYQPTAEDVVQIAACDLLLTVGGTSDRWVEEILASQPNDGRRVCRIRALEGITLQQISSESVEADCEDEACHDHSHGHEHGTEEPDEHLWLSLKNARIACDAIASELKELDETNSEIYAANASRYAAALGTLDQQFDALVSGSTDPAVVFADRFPFVYMMEDYGIRYVAAFRGCTTDTDADFETVRRLAERVDQWGLTCLLVTESETPGLAEQVRANTRDKNQQILAMNSLQSITKDRLEAGATYLGEMENNFRVLSLALAGR